MKKFPVKTIDKYQIRTRLGQGSMGQVYKIILPGEKRFAALKVLKPRPALVKKMGMEWIYERFLHEAQVASNLNHPNVVNAWGLKETGGLAYYLMEYFPRNLGLIMGESYWADRPCRILRIGKAVDYISETLSGLSSLHHAGVVHHDIKPFNLMLTKEGRVKIADFGLSKRRGETFEMASYLIVGTPYYAAPEQEVSPEHADLRADLYSVGVMFYRMLTGILPQPPVTPPASVNVDLDKGWDELILKAIHPDPGRRFQDAESMRLEIQNHYQAFRHQKQKACSIDKVAFRLTTKADKLRSKPERVLAKHAKLVFNIDEANHPRQYFNNRFEMTDGGVAIDRNTALLWQQAGSEKPMQWEDAEHYIAGLNEEKLGGIDNWRLPTINELLSLLHPPPPGEDFCFQPQMSSVQKWIWSGDVRSKWAAWFVDIEMGFVASGDILDCYYVKAVCSV